jgi:hypothetical protein
MTEVVIAAIVEGHGECEAAPILVRRIAATIDPGFVPQVLPPLRVPASKLLKADELERAVDLAARKLQGRGGILVLVDCDWEGGCPAKDGPALLEMAKAARADLPITVVLAKQEFEAWFLAAAESLRGKAGLPEDLAAPENPEEIRGAKEWLRARMPWGRSYSETVDQPAFTARFDLDAARKADSFDKCFREIDKMLRGLRARKPQGS